MISSAIIHSFQHTYKVEMNLGSAYCGPGTLLGTEVGSKNKTFSSIPWDLTADIALCTCWQSKFLVCLFRNGVGNLCWDTGGARDSASREWREPSWPDSDSAFPKTPPAYICSLEVLLGHGQAEEDTSTPQCSETRRSGAWKQGIQN